MCCLTTWTKNVDHIFSVCLHLYVYTLLKTACLCSLVSAHPWDSLVWFIYFSSFLLLPFFFFCKSFAAHLHDPLHFVSFSKRCDGRSKQDAGQLKWFTQEILMHLLRWDKAALLHFKHLHVAGVAMSCCTACLYSWAIHLASGSPAHLYQLWKRRWKCKLTK